jgi:hypothetical protein
MFSRVLGWSHSETSWLVWTWVSTCALSFLAILGFKLMNLWGNLGGCLAPLVALELDDWLVLLHSQPCLATIPVGHPIQEET